MGEVGGLTYICTLCSMTWQLFNIISTASLLTTWRRSLHTGLVVSWGTQCQCMSWRVLHLGEVLARNLPLDGIASWNFSAGAGVGVWVVVVWPTYHHCLVSTARNTDTVHQSLPVGIYWYFVHKGRKSSIWRNKMHKRAFGWGKDDPWK